MRPSWSVPVVMSAWSLGACVPGQPSASELLDRAIAYHDPAGEWNAFQGTLHLEELRPNGRSRAALVRLDLPNNHFEYRMDRDQTVVKRVTGDAGAYRVDGRTSVSGVEEERLALTCDRMRALATTTCTGGVCP